MTATARVLPGNRLHLSHGPIDLVIGADGVTADVERAYGAAAACFPEILPQLVAQLPFLRAPVDALALPPAVSSSGVRPSGSATNRSRFGERAEADPIWPARSVADRMAAAVWPYRDRFITPMAAVAGSVADHVLAQMLAVAPLRRAYVNNGGDIALHLAPSAVFTAGVVGDLTAPGIDARIAIGAGDGIGGIATSGWRGRSQSLGIADAVTVLAATAAAADAAATMIANAVDVDDPAVERRPAREVKDDSDLGDLPVTVAVGRLSAAACLRALAAGQARAREILGQNRIIAAYIQLQGEMRVVGASRLIAGAA